MNVVAEFHKVDVVQKNWPGGTAQGKQEKHRWEEFVQSTAEPLVELWRQHRYAAVIRALPAGRRGLRSAAARGQRAQFPGFAPAGGRLAAGQAGDPALFSRTVHPPAG